MNTKKPLELRNSRNRNQRHLAARKSPRTNAQPATAIYRRGNQRRSTPSTNEEINEDQRHLPKRKSTRTIATYRRGNQRGSTPSTEEEINADHRRRGNQRGSTPSTEEETNEDHRHLHGLGGTTTWTRKNRWISYGRPLDTASNQSEERHQLIFKFHDAVLIESMIQPCTTQLLRLETYSRPAESPQYNLCRSKTSITVSSFKEKITQTNTNQSGITLANLE